MRLPKIIYAGGRMEGADRWIESLEDLPAKPRGQKVKAAK